MAAQQTETFTSRQVVQAVDRYINDQGKFSMVPEGFLAGEILKEGQDAYQNYLDYLHSIYRHTDAKRLTADEIADILHENASCQDKAVQHEIIAFFHALEAFQTDTDFQQNRHQGNHHQHKAQGRSKAKDKFRNDFNEFDWASIKEKIQQLNKKIIKP